MSYSILTEDSKSLSRKLEGLSNNELDEILNDDAKIEDILSNADQVNELVNHGSSSGKGAPLVDLKRSHSSKIKITSEISEKPLLKSITIVGVIHEKDCR